MRWSTSVIWGLLAGAVVFAAFAIPLHRQQMEREKARICVQNVKLIGMALLTYASDHENRLPPAGAYPAVVANYPLMMGYPERTPHPLSRQTLVCPADPQQAMPGYAYNRLWAGAELATIPAPSVNVLLYEATGGQLVFRHRGESTNVTYCDGHVHAMWPHCFDMRDVNYRTGPRVQHAMPPP
ncbi:MAG: hypothetical protein KKI08_16790 [Armatimonadetes bacterium]|nr:hypothetical protein [Armatimonadota bacterium]